MKNSAFLIVIFMTSLIAFAQGPELVTNGDFESPTPDGWYSVNGGLNIVTEAGGNRLNQRDGLPPGGNVFDVNLSQIVNLEDGKEPI